MAHPLNRAVIDPETNIVAQGLRNSAAARRHQRPFRAPVAPGGHLLRPNRIRYLHRPPFPTSIKISSAKAVTWAKASTMSMSSRRHSAKRFPHDILLSHDLIEGTHARAGPGLRYRSDRRLPFALHARGPSASTAGCAAIGRSCSGCSAGSGLTTARACPIRFSIISLWKILDNLRRSLIEIAIFVLLMAGWTFLPGEPGYWTARRDRGLVAAGLHRVSVCAAAHAVSTRRGGAHLRGYGFGISFRPYRCGAAAGFSGAPDLPDAGRHSALGHSHHDDRAAVCWNGKALRRRKWAAGEAEIDRQLSMAGKPIGRWSLVRSCSASIPPRCRSRCRF